MPSPDFLEETLAMQPLSRVRPDAPVAFDQPTTMVSQPQIAILIAQCIAEWSETELALGLFLAYLLGADTPAAVSMYSAVDNRAAQLRMIEAAAERKLPPAHHEIFQALMLSVIRPAMRERDRLAHWCWASTPEIPDALLIVNPQENLWQRSQLGGEMQPDFDPMKRDHMYVVKQADLERTLMRIREAKTFSLNLGATVWSFTRPSTRAEVLRKLSNEPRVQQAVLRLRKRQKSNQESHQQSPAPEKED